MEMYCEFHSIFLILENIYYATNVVCTFRISESAGVKKIYLSKAANTPGISKKILSLCDKTVTIPMYGKNASLNVNVSVGIVLFSF